MMKKLIYTFTVTIALLCFTTYSLHSAVEAEKPELNSDSKTTKLLERIAQLEKRVAELEKKQSVKITTIPSDDFIPSGDFFLEPKLQHQFDMPVLPKVDPYPKGWKQKQINGMKYYLLPLNLPQ